MKIYKVKVNGKVYEVELESVSEKAGSIAAQPAAAAPVAASGEGTPLKAPMQGTILSVKVAAGDAVKKGQTVCYIEAMKTFNAIAAESDGVIAEICFKSGDSVSEDDVLMKIK